MATLGFLGIFGPRNRLEEIDWAGERRRRHDEQNRTPWANPQHLDPQLVVTLQRSYDYFDYFWRVRFFQPHSLTYFAV